MIADLSDIQNTLKRALNMPCKIDVVKSGDGRYRARVQAIGSRPTTASYGPTPLDALLTAAIQSMKDTDHKGW